MRSYKSEPGRAKISARPGCITSKRYSAPDLSRTTREPSAQNWDEPSAAISRKPWKQTPRTPRLKTGAFPPNLRSTSAARRVFRPTSHQSPCQTPNALHSNSSAVVSSPLGANWFRMIILAQVFQCRRASSFFGGRNASAFSNQVMASRRNSYASWLAPG